MSTLTTKAIDEAIKEWMDGPYGESLRKTYGPAVDAGEQRRCRIQLATAAGGYVAVCSAVPPIDPVPDAVGSDWRRGEIVLLEAALAYAASLGNASAAERAELATLRRFHEGIVSLRAELTACSDLNLVKETIDAFIAMSFPLKLETR